MMPPSRRDRGTTAILALRGTSAVAAAIASAERSDSSPDSDEGWEEAESVCASECDLLDERPFGLQPSPSDAETETLPSPREPLPETETLPSPREPPPETETVPSPREPSSSSDVQKNDGGATACGGAPSAALQNELTPAQSLDASPPAVQAPVDIALGAGGDDLDEATTTAARAPAPRRSTRKPPPNHATPGSSLRLRARQPRSSSLTLPIDERSGRRQRRELILSTRPVPPAPAASRTRAFDAAGDQSGHEAIGRSACEGKHVTHTCGHAQEPAPDRRDTKPVQQLDSSTSEVLRTFPSMKVALASLGKNPKSGNIYDACEGRKSTAYGFTWRWRQDQGDEADDGVGASADENAVDENGEGGEAEKRRAPLEAPDAPPPPPSPSSAAPAPAKAARVVIEATDCPACRAPEKHCKHTCSRAIGGSPAAPEPAKAARVVIEATDCPACRAPEKHCKHTCSRAIGGSSAAPAPAKAARVVIEATDCPACRAPEKHCKHTCSRAIGGPAAATTNFPGWQGEHRTHSRALGETVSATISCPACQGKHRAHTCSGGKRQAKKSAKQRDEKRTRVVDDCPPTVVAGSRDRAELPGSSMDSEEKREVAHGEEMKSNDVPPTIPSVPEESIPCRLESSEAQCDDEQQIWCVSLVLCDDDSDAEPDHPMNSIQKEQFVGSSQFETIVAHYDVTGQTLLMPPPQARSCGSYCTRAGSSVAAELTRSTDFILSGLHVPPALRAHPAEGFTSFDLGNFQNGREMHIMTNVDACHAELV